MSWVQKDVQHVQQAPQHHPHVSIITRAPSSQTSHSGQEQLWNEHHQQELERLENLNLATTSHSYPTTVLDMTIMHPRRGFQSEAQLIPAHSPYSPFSKEYMNLTDSIRTTASNNNIPPNMKTTSGEPRSCLVCREKAGKHSYYGGLVCPSCRAFFRRSVQSGYNATYLFPKDNNCKINLKTRKGCQFCRYKLCVAAGMKTAWVFTEDA
jgi:hypothetical protein